MGDAYERDKHGKQPPPSPKIQEMLDELFGPLTGTKKEQKSVKWKVKHIDGVRYVPLSQVVDLLKVNDILPGVRKGLQRYLGLKDE